MAAPFFLLVLTSPDSSVLMMAFCFAPFFLVVPAIIMLLRLARIQRRDRGAHQQRFVWTSSQDLVNGSMNVVGIARAGKADEPLANISIVRAKVAELWVEQERTVEANPFWLELKDGVRVKVHGVQGAVLQIGTTTQTHGTVQTESGYLEEGDLVSVIGDVEVSEGGYRGLGQRKHIRGSGRRRLTIANQTGFRKRAGKTAKAIAAMMGIALVLATSATYLWQRDLTDIVQTTTTVVGHREEERTSGGRFSMTRYTVTLAEVQIAGRVCAIADRPTGSQVEVRYQRFHPKDCWIAGETRINTLALLTGILATTLALLAIVLGLALPANEVAPTFRVKNPKKRQA
ncbi:MAG: hypothetical protein U0271_15380 [Polyangiaceae bacterium]